MQRDICARYSTTWQTSSVIPSFLIHPFDLKRNAAIRPDYVYKQHRQMLSSAASGYGVITMPRPQVVQLNKN